MADQVQRRLESMLGDLQKWRSKQLFTADEVRGLYFCFCFSSFFFCFLFFFFFFFSFFFFCLLFFVLSFLEIVRRRTKHEYKVASKAPSILDYLRYLAYETNVSEKERKKERKKEGEFYSNKQTKTKTKTKKQLYHKLTQRTQGMKSDRRKVHGMQTKRLHTLYQRTLFKYPTDLVCYFFFYFFCFFLSFSPFHFLTTPSRN